MMHVLIAIALKSVIVAGGTLGLLALMKRRSAAERSWVAHTGLVALILLALAPLVLPSWTVESPALLGQTPPPVAAASATPPSAGAAASVAGPGGGASAPAPTAAEPDGFTLDPAAAAAVLYALPAAILLLVTFLALARLVALQARADVLVDGHWLSALARAQRRMGFKYGTALLTSDELASPISWGMMRPVILLNSRAVEAAGEAEAIIAHELAHVARMDWVKLLLARVACALFWFNPFVWMLAREAHQLREEAADDAVLDADIPDTDYAQLLVGVARHECPGLLLGAHGVAPSRSSLARRVARVLDAASPRGPVARSFAAGVVVGGLLVAAPLAALTLTPGGRAEAVKAARAAGMADPAEPQSPYYVGSETPTDLATIIADGVRTSVTAVAAAQTGDVHIEGWDMYDDAEDAREAAEERRQDAIERAHDAAERARDAAARARDGAARARDAAARGRDAAHRARDGLRLNLDLAGLDRDIERVVEMKAMGVTPQYIAEMRAAAPALRKANSSEFVGMKAVGVTPAFARDMVAAGFRNIDDGDLTQARAIGLTGSYIQELKAAGVHASLDQYVEMRAVGVSPKYVRKLRDAGFKFKSVDQLVEMQALGINPQSLKASRSVRPPPVPPRNWDPINNPNPDPDDS